MDVTSALIESVKLWPNTGQVPGLPTNPRLIKDERFDRLVKSIIDDPEMMELREVLVFPYAGEYVIIAGNMRHKACVHIIGLTDDEFTDLVNQRQNDADFNSWLKAISDFRSNKLIPCKVLPADTPPHKLRAFAIKDNVPFGENDWDILANEWDEVELTAFGLEIPVWDDSELEEESESEKKSVVKLVIEFDSLEEYDAVKTEIRTLLEGYSGAKLKD